MKSPPLTLRALQPGDEQAVRSTFAQAFGEERSSARWRWAFRDNPAGTRAFLALDADSVVAQFAALPARTLVLGEEQSCAQVVDSMLHPDWRRGLTRRGPFVRTAEAFFDAHGARPDHPRGERVYYGWPIDANRRLGERLLGYERAGRQLVLVAGLGGLDSGLLTDELRLHRIERFDHQARWLFERCAAEWALATVRDATYLDWRYVARPDVGYRRLGVFDREGLLRGLAVTRLAGGEHRALGAGEGLALVCEWLVPVAEEDVGRFLLDALARDAVSAGAHALALFLPGWSPWFTRFQASGFRARATPWDLVVRSFDRRIDAELLRAGFWLQLGDSDLV